MSTDSKSSFARAPKVSEDFDPDSLLDVATGSSSDLITETEADSEITSPGIKLEPEEKDEKTTVNGDDEASPPNLDLEEIFGEKTVVAPESAPRVALPRVLAGPKRALGAEPREIKTSVEPAPRVSSPLDEATVNMQLPPKPSIVLDAVNHPLVEPQLENKPPASRASVMDEATVRIQTRPEPPPVGKPLSDLPSLPKFTADQQEGMTVRIQSQMPPVTFDGPTVRMQSPLQPTPPQTGIPDAPANGDSSIRIRVHSQPVASHTDEQDPDLITEQDSDFSRQGRRSKARRSRSEKDHNARLPMKTLAVVFGFIILLWLLFRPGSNDSTEKRHVHIPAAAVAGQPEPRPVLDSKTTENALEVLDQAFRQTQDQLR